MYRKSHFCIEFKCFSSNSFMSEVVSVSKRTKLSLGMLSVFTSHYLPLCSIVMIRDFVRDYNRLMDLLCHKWDYSAKYIDPCPGVTPDFSKAGEYAKEKLTDMAQRIKELEEQDRHTDKLSDCYTECMLLRKKFGDAFDILKPFGLVFTTYEPYFEMANPQSRDGEYKSKPFESLPVPLKFDPKKRKLPKL